MQEILCNKYEILKPLADGAQGSVFLAGDLHLGRQVAIKVYTMSDGENGQEYIRQEREVLKRLSHPCLVQVLDYFEEEGYAYLVMEYVEGITLAEYLDRFGAVDTAVAVNWCVELTEALGYLHGQNPPVIYRDLKPGNIMVRRDGGLKLIDFGTAGAADYGSGKKRELMGTPGYSAPEQWQLGKTDKQSDIYALGIVLHEMLTGTGPVKALYERRPVREYDRSISPEVEKIVSNCTMENPQQRYASMEKVREALLMYKKKDRKSSILFMIHHFLGIGLWIAVFWDTIVPLLKGVPESAFPLPYLIRPLLGSLAAFLYHRCLWWRYENPRFIKKQENSVFLTEKQFPGMSKELLFLFFLVIQMMLIPFAGGQTETVKAGEKPGELWVDMRDEENRKMLVKEGAVYPVKERLRFDISKENLPKGPVSVRIFASGKQGEVLESRVFLVEGN